jgi:hypothetical protein
MSIFGIVSIYRGDDLHACSRFWFHSSCLSTLKFIQNTNHYRQNIRMGYLFLFEGSKTKLNTEKRGRKINRKFIVMSVTFRRWKVTNTGRKISGSQMVCRQERVWLEAPALSNWLAGNPETSLGELYYRSCGYLDCTLNFKNKIGVSMVSCHILALGCVHRGTYSQTSVSYNLLSAGAIYGYAAIVSWFL